MSLSLLSNATAVGMNLTCPFSGAGGTPPYSYSVLGGGAGGSINPTTGLYASPGMIGIDTIQVTDSLNAHAQAQIRIGNVFQLVCDILETELGLSPGRVFLWDQKINQPNDSGLYIAVGILNCKPFGNTRAIDASDLGVNIIQSVNMLATLSIDIMSRGIDARDRKEEVIMALRSIYAQQQQELNSFHIAGLSSQFLNLSQEDGAAIPYRFNISVNIQYFVTKTKAVSYFDTFETPTFVINN